MSLAQELTGHVWEKSASPHGNYVLQRCVEVMPPERVQFMISEMCGRAVSAAQDAKRCRVLQRLIEHCPHWQTKPLVEELVASAERLFRHAYGNFVIQNILEQGEPECRHRLAEMMVPELKAMSKHR